MAAGLVMAPFKAARAQLTPPGLFLARSVSGQFIIQSAPTEGASPLIGVLENDTNFVRLDPTLLTVSCERIKAIVWRELEADSGWSAKVFLKLFATGSADDPITIDSERFRDGWQYGVTLPNVIQRERYIRAIVSVLLLELANRHVAGRSAEIPIWLIEGLTRQLAASNEREIILPPPEVSRTGFRMTTLLLSARQHNPLEQAHKELSAAPALTFQQLSWPVDDQLTGEPGEQYRSSAQFFVHQLLSLPGGPRSLRSMLEELPQYYNWQFAFLRAFRDDFQQPLDVEKWWSLQLVHFTGRELAETWPLEESWRKLDEVVRSAVAIRIGTNELPLHAEVALQTIIRDWEPARQTAALGNKLRELQMARLRLARQLVPLVDEYCAALETFLQNLNHTGFVFPFRKHTIARRNAAEALQRLDALDSRRASMRPVPNPAAPSQSVVGAASPP